MRVCVCQLGQSNRLRGLRFCSLTIMNRLLKECWNCNAISCVRGLTCPATLVTCTQAENKFKCPCHGSQYDAAGKVVRGPAPLSLALAHADVDESGLILFSPW